jgi:hypothetical protein
MPLVDPSEELHSYTVGHNQIEGTGDQKKLFVSKSTLIYSTEDTFVVFNSRNNAKHTVLANTYYEFKSNIFVVFHPPATSGNGIYFWFEGVMYNEARRPE